jgi:hypothetical protein
MFDLGTELPAQAMPRNDSTAKITTMTPMR